MSDKKLRAEAANQDAPSGSGGAPKKPQTTSPTTDTTQTPPQSTAGKDSEAPSPEPARKKRQKKWPIVLGIVAIVVVAAGAGLWVWHEQPSFCNAICHTPMDTYLDTWNNELDAAGVDKYGNEVSDTHGMLVVTHKQPIEEGGADAECLSCHVPDIGEQITEATNWISGNYEYPLPERDDDDLTKARGLEGDVFCLNASCHNLTRQELREQTADMKRNPHAWQHGEIACSECHKAHRQSVVYCTQCHSDSVIPEGWLTVAQAKKLEGVA
ncbi:MAG: cytochrome c3 family protein [Coriobacteriales bacterium]|jgi:hypothetical protein|nr:cytochrome c3 family protein [Coriobacteriales bacterium]